MSGMSLWERIFAAAYDPFMAASEETGLARHRQALLATASGRVLEVGGGTGANLPFYGDGVTEVVITEPSAPMAGRLARKLARRTLRAPVRLVQAPAERLPFEAASFDCAVTTLVLCTVADLARSLAEVRRVLKPRGRLLFIEHVRSGDARLARHQHRLNWLNQLVMCCDCNRPTLGTIEQAGFTVADVEHTELPKAPPFVRPTVTGCAMVPVAARR